MTLIAKIFTPCRIKSGRGYRNHVYRHLLVTCDLCSCSFVVKNCVKAALKKKAHFCCVQHQVFSQQKNGLLDVKKKALFNERYGVNTPLEIKKVHERGIEAANSPISREKAKQTSLKNWGVPFPTQHPRHIAKCNLPASIQKCNETKRRNGSMRESEPERQLRSLLIEQYGQDNVRSHVRLHRCSVDIYVTSIDTYVQLDGVYWHGLDRPLSELQELAKENDQARVILEKYTRDRMLDEYCALHNIRLIRITDVEFINDQRSCLERIINANH